MKWLIDRLIPKPFAHITYMGETVIDYIHCIPNYFVDSDDAENYKIKLVWMTEHQYRNLPEFTGF